MSVSNQYGKVPLSALGLSTRSRLLWARSGISTLGGLESWLQNGCKPIIRGVGNGLISEARSALEEYVTREKVIARLGI